MPGDKSVAHRALLIAAIAPGASLITNFPAGEDVRATANCLRQLGIEILIDGREATVRRHGPLRRPRALLHARNSGTTMRLLSGVLAGQQFESTIVGDRSLSRRPMNRVIKPLVAMGAGLESTSGYAPLHIRGARLHGITYSLPIASAQVKSAIMLAALQATGATIIRETARTRDHTERMFCAAGITVARREYGESGCEIRMAGGQTPHALSVDLPGDVSSAAFFFSASALSGCPVTVTDVGLNPTRVAFLRVLEQMGCQVHVANQREEFGEPVGDVSLSGRVAHPVQVSSSEAPLLIDELPLLALLATQTPGVSRIAGAAELRVKETDRISTTLTALRRLGANMDELPDGFRIQGGTTLHGTTVDSTGDHRLAMMLAVAGSIARGETIIERSDAATISFPEFADVFHRLGGRIDAA